MQGVRRANATGTAQFSVSDTGTLVYLAGPASLSSGSLDLAVLDSKGLIELGPTVQRPYDITPDGKVVGVVTAGATEGGVAIASRLEVVLNWLEELKQRVPVK